MNKIASTDISPPPGGPVTLDLYAQRQKIQVRSVSGFFQNIRVVTIWGMLTVFMALPWMTWKGRQALLFDLPGRHFYLFGWTFQPQDFIYLSWLLAIGAFSLFALTVVAGRVYCGYVCPQTVWTKIFIWIEKFTEGERNARLRLDRSPLTINKVLRRSMKHAGWMAVALATGITFIGYFSPVRELYGDLWHLRLGFWQVFWVLFFTATTYLNAGWMREQVCMFMCPYGRFQSVMFDRDTLIISYDAKRGDPRGSRKRGSDPHALGLGDCIDCDMCVQVCPTGIDIRDGLQFQCIQCAACIDACDGIMRQMGYDKGMVRYTSENTLETGQPLHVLRPRLLGYVAVLSLLCGLFLYSLAGRIPLTVEAIHDRNQLYRESNDGTIENSYLLKVMNESQQMQRYSLSLEGDKAIHVEAMTPPSFSLRPGEMVSLPVTLEADPGYLADSHYSIRFVIAEMNDTNVKQAAAGSFLAPASR